MPKPERIMLISHEMTYTGAPNSLLNMARILRKNGHMADVYTLVSGGWGDFQRRFQRYGFTVKCLDADRLNADQCKRLAEKYDLAVCNTVFCGKLACILQDYMKTVLFIREAKNLPDILRDCKIDEGYIRNAENIVCVSEYAESFIRRVYDPKRLWVLHNFLMKSRFYRPTANKVRDGRVRFLIAATIERRKGIDIAIDAVKLLPKSVSQHLVLEIAGRKPQWSESYWKGLIPENDERIVYLGEVTGGKKRLFKRANVILVPSLDEACSLTALEGAMLGKPLIVTENVGAKYLTRGSGFIVKTGNAEELANAMRFFAENRQELETAGNISFKRFCETSSYKTYYENITKIFSEVLGE